MSDLLYKWCVVCFAGLLTASCWQADAQLPLSSDQRPGWDQYESLVRQGDAALEKGDLDLAHAKFEAASRVLLPEAPNYEVLLRLASVEKHKKKSEECLGILDDFECMLDVEIGEQRCFEPAKPGFLGKRNPDLTAECFQRMCGEIFLGYYEDPTEEIRGRVKGMRGQAATLRSQCEQGLKTATRPSSSAK